LFVSHNMNAVSKLCKSVIVLSQGQTPGISLNVSESIAEYLNPRNAERQMGWENINNQATSEYLTPIRFFARQGDIASGLIEFRNDYPISVSVEGIIHKTSSALNIGIALYTIDGIFLFWSFSNDTPLPFWINLNPGKFVITCIIPAHFLNEGTYIVEFVAGLHSQAWLFAPGGSVPRFEFAIRDGLSDSPMWIERRAGLLAPILQWSRTE
jgi:lipopolysaccharide transport system ATP-binding protein